MATGFMLTHDGEPVSGKQHAGEMGVMSEMLRAQPFSTDYATTWGGYAVIPVELDIWPADEAAALATKARRMFRDHGHEMTFDDADERDMVMSSCGACALNGYGADDDGPNYGAWARTYVQAGRKILPEWRAAFERELESDNRAYAAALARDVRTFGRTFGGFIGREYR